MSDQAQNREMLAEEYIRRVVVVTAYDLKDYLHCDWATIAQIIAQMVDGGLLRQTSSQESNFMKTTCYTWVGWADSNELKARIYDLEQKNKRQTEALEKIAKVIYDGYRIDGYTYAEARVVERLRQIAQEGLAK